MIVRSREARSESPCSCGPMHNFVNTSFASEDPSYSSLDTFNMVLFRNLACIARGRGDKCKPQDAATNGQASQAPAFMGEWSQGVRQIIGPGRVLIDRESGLSISVVLGVRPWCKATGCLRLLALESGKHGQRGLGAGPATPPSSSFGGVKNTHAADALHLVHARAPLGALMPSRPPFWHLALASSSENCWAGDWHPAIRRQSLLAVCTALHIAHLTDFTHPLLIHDFLISVAGKRVLTVHPSLVFDIYYFLIISFQSRSFSPVFNSCFFLRLRLSSNSQPRVSSTRSILASLKSDQRPQFHSSWISVNPLLLSCTHQLLDYVCL